MDNNPLSGIISYYMTFPDRKRDLLNMFRNAPPAAPPELEGEYLVDILTFAPSLRRASHRKVIYADNGRIAGYNVVLGRQWGRFTVESGACGDVDSLPAAIINYDRPENIFPLRRIRDCVRSLENKRFYIGRYYYFLFGRLRFLGYFSMERVK